jgi:hypothetical protein
MFTCPYCSAFAFPTPDDLVAHLTESHSSPAMPSPSPVPAPISSNGNGSTATQTLVAPPPTSPAPTPPQMRTIPPTPKQEAYLCALLKQHPEIRVDWQSLTRATASDLIDQLKNGTPNNNTTTPDTSPTNTTEPPEGVHDTGGHLILVQRSKAGHLYTKTLRNDGRWDYTGTTMLATLSQATLRNIA